RSAWERQAQKGPSRRARCDSCRCTHESIENVFGLTWAASLSSMERSPNALVASQTIIISVSRRETVHPLSSSSNNIGHEPFKKSTWPPKEARCTFRRGISMGLAAPDHTVPYGTVLSRTLSQALRARLRSVCPLRDGLADGSQRPLT
ncbi:MAG: hypothetical protein QOG92_656, partial [Verrucomicrobiota bacterium]|nr:hypothetical protein [Verrucomicrobiota bacterium]